jgi:uncharacterized protein YndB with AHSA1/START domain
MTIHTCPTDVVHASAERVWHVLTTPDELARWSRTRVVRGPSRPLVTGDRLVLGAGLGHRLTVLFHVLEAAPPHRLTVDVYLPFGVVNHEAVVITPISANECNVGFN